MKRALLAAVFALLVVAPAAAQDSEPSFCVSAWYRASEQPGAYDSLMRAADVVDVVHPMWYAPRDDGSVTIMDGAEDPQKLAAWREAGFRIMPAFFSTLSVAIDQPEVRTRHVEEIAALVERMDYDGIDIDYEEFRASARDAFSAFIEELAAALHAHSRLLSVTIQAKTSEPGNDPGSAAHDYSRLMAAADVINIMTYDYTGRNSPPGPISPPDWVNQVLDYAGTITSLDRVHFGMPFYAYSWQRGNPPARTTSWESIQPWIESFGAEVERLPASGEGLVDFKPPGLPRQVVVLNDGESVRHRMETVLAAHPDVGGLSIWGLGGEDPSVWDAVADLRPAACNL
ncbi:MAG: glycosyl hydrolase family 18 protein [Anaerolineae bacterium]